MCISEEPEDTEVFFLPRNNEEGGAFDPNASVGTRTIYREETDSIVTFKDNSYIAEYDIQSGEEIYSAKTEQTKVNRIAKTITMIQKNEKI